MAASDAFWDWSVSNYEKAGVADRLLELQDDLKLNVNLVLWCIWAAEDHAPIQEFAMRQAIEACSGISENVTLRIRSARKWIKSNMTAEVALYEALKTIELDAERIEQGKLSSISQRFLQTGDQNQETDRNRARINLALYLRLAGAINMKNFSVHLIESLLDSIFQIDEPSKQRSG